MNDEKKEIELECPPIEYERKESNKDSETNKTNQTEEDKLLFSCLAWPVDKLIKHIDKKK